MRILFFTALFFIGLNFPAQSQADISYPQWQHPVLQQARAGAKALYSFNNKDSTSFITVSILDKKQKIIYWFDRFGYYFDAVPIGDNNIQAILTRKITAFKYYHLITSAYLKVIGKARSNLQANGNTARFTAYEKQLLQIEDSLRFPSTLKKLIELDKQKLSVERQIREFNSVDPQTIKADSVFTRTINLPYGSMQTTWGEEDTITTYYNRIALQPIYKALLKHRDATIAYYNRGGQLIDEVSINKNALTLLFSDKTDVFLLYRGWLEMQRFGIVKSIAGIKAAEKELSKAQKSTATNTVNVKTTYQPLLTSTKKLLQVTDYKINYLTTIDRGFVSQCLRNQYLQTSNTLTAEEARLSAFARGNKYYELTDMRGNVMAVVTDKRIAHSANGPTIDYYEADVAAATDYAPFGSALPGRSYQSDTYRYGFNGKEDDNEVKGEDNQQDYGMRIYDPRLGRFLSVDPIGAEFPMLTPYQFASNTPIVAIDLDGLEGEWMSKIIWDTRDRIRRKDGDAAAKEYDKGVRTGGMVTAVTLVDVFLTKGWLSRIAMGSQTLGAFEHNRAKTPEGRVAQDKRSKEALADAFIIFGVGKMIGGFTRTTTASKDIEYIFTKEDYQTLVFDPDKGKITADAIQELKVALTAEAKVGSITARAAQGTGADFVTTKGLIDIKNVKKFIDAANGSQKEFFKLVGTIKANKDVKYVIDFKDSNISTEKFNAVMTKFYEAGVNKRQIVTTGTSSVSATKIKTF